jgi:hypothetical protein
MMMRIRLVGLMVLVIVVAGMGIVGAESQEVPRDEAYLKAREQMADLLASEEFEKVEIAAASFDRAMVRIYEAVETYLDQVIPALGDVEITREFGVDVLQGLNEHRIRYSGEDGYDLAGKRRILIANDKDAHDLGELLAEVALLIHSGHGSPGIDVRMAARRIFEGMLPVDGTQQPLVSQYLVRLKMLSKSDRKELLKYALE